MRKKRRTRVLIHGRDGTIDILLEGKPISAENMRLEVFYDRDKKPKILNRAELPNKKLSFDNLKALESLDGLLAVDTGTNELNGYRLSVGCLFHSVFEKDQRGLRTSWRPIMFVAIRNSKVSPERLAAAHLLALAARIPEFTQQKLGIVIDFDLDRLEAINKGEAFLVDGVSFPAYWKFIYSSADGGAEFPTNRLIRRVDREANRLFEHLRTRADIEVHVPSVVSSFCEGLAVWSVQPGYLLPLEPAFT